MSFARSSSNDPRGIKDTGPKKTIPTSNQYRASKLPQTFKLTYFDFPGRGELSRLLFSVAGRKFEDNRIQFSDWSALKASGTTPFGTLPLLEVTNADGTSFKLGQSMCIARFLANKFNLAGKNEEDKAEVEMFSEVLNDLLIASVHLQTSNENDRPKMIEKYLEVTYPTHLTFIEKKLTKTNTGYIVGNSLTVVDLFCTTLLDTIISMDIAHESDLLGRFPKVKAHMLKIREVPAVKRWNAAHKK